MKKPIEQFVGKLGSNQELTDAQMEAIKGGGISVPLPPPSFKIKQAGVLSKLAVIFLYP